MIHLFKKLKWIFIVFLTSLVGCLFKKVRRIDTTDYYKDKEVAKLAEAVRVGDVKLIKELVAKGVNPNAESIPGVITEGKTNLLEWAIFSQSKKGFAALLDAGADPLMKQDDPSGQTLVHFAAMLKDPDYLEVLLKYGVNPNVRNKRNGDTPIFDADVGSKNFQLLLDAGADINAQRDGGANLLFVTHEVNMVKKLLEMGVDATVKDHRGDTFQDYFFMTPESVLTKEAKEEREWVRQWLRKRGLYKSTF